jgi:hypothetical protein
METKFTACFTATIYCTGSCEWIIVQFARLWMMLVWLKWAGNGFGIPGRVIQIGGLCKRQ